MIQKPRIYPTMTLEEVEANADPHTLAYIACRHDCDILVQLAIRVYAPQSSPRPGQPLTVTECLDGIRHCVIAVNEAFTTDDPSATYRRLTDDSPNALPHDSKAPPAPDLPLDEDTARDTEP